MKTILHATTLALLTQTILLGSELDSISTTTYSTPSAKVNDDFYVTLGLPSPTSSQSLSSSTITHTSARSTPSTDLSSLLSKIRALDEENTYNDELGAHSEVEISNKVGLLRALDSLEDTSPEAILKNINSKSDEGSRTLFIAYKSYTRAQENDQLPELIQSLKRIIRSQNPSKESLQTACGLLYILDCHLLCNEGLGRLLPL